ncbi:MAG: DUF4124 domain-containing protein [Alteromonadaceae bacterium]|nr:DUF4124 domain-containing protein [Alteromonadaceae bacterium]
MLKIFIATLLLLTLAIPVLAASDKVYVWKNEKGVLVFSDIPRADAEEVSVKNQANVMPSTNTSILDIKPKLNNNDYTLDITQPENNATIRDNTGSVHVIGRIKPIFKHGLNIQLNFDGKPYGKPQNHSRFALRNVNRGEHQIKMELLDQRGKVIASSVITFYMHRTSVFKAK